MVAPDDYTPKFLFIIDIPCPSCGDRGHFRPGRISCEKCHGTGKIKSWKVPTRIQEILFRKFGRVS